MYIELSKYKNRIEQITRYSGVRIEGIEIVSDIRSWCVEHNIPENSSERIAKCLKNKDSGKYLLLFKSRISLDQIDSIARAMRIRGSEATQVALLNCADTFVSHLVLHECAHATDESFTELECDTWAFSKLGKI